MAKETKRTVRVIGYDGWTTDVQGTGWVTTQQGHLEVYDDTRKVAEFSRGNWLSVLFKAT